MEGLAAFFLESTFLGLLALRLGSAARSASRRHDLGWSRSGRLSARSSCGELVDAASRRVRDGSDGRPQLNNIGAVFTNPVFVWGYAHVVLASLVTGSLVMLGVSTWHLRRTAPRARSSARRTPPWWCWSSDPAEPHRRQQAGHHRDDVPTDEDRRSGSAVANLRTPCSFSAFQMRRRQVRRDRRRRSSRSRICCRCSRRAHGMARCSA